MSTMKGELKIFVENPSMCDIILFILVNTVKGGERWIINTKNFLNTL